MHRKLLLALFTTCLAFAASAQDNYISFVMGGRKFHFTGEEARSTVIKPSGDRQQTKLYSDQGVGAPLNVSINFVTPNGKNPSTGTPLLTSNEGNTLQSAFVDMTIAEGTAKKYYTTLKQSDGSVTITSAKDGFVEGRFSVIVNEKDGEDRWELIDGSFRMKL